jgi:hypothetical protein
MAVVIEVSLREMVICLPLARCSVAGCLTGDEGHSILPGLNPF